MTPAKPISSFLLYRMLSPKRFRRCVFVQRLERPRCIVLSTSIIARLPPPQHAFSAMRTRIRSRRRMRRIARFAAERFNRLVALPRQRLRIFALQEADQFLADLGAKVGGRGNVRRGQKR